MRERDGDKYEWPEVEVWNWNDRIGTIECRGRMAEAEAESEWSFVAAGSSFKLVIKSPFQFSVLLLLLHHQPSELNSLLIPGSSSFSFSLFSRLCFLSSLNSRFFTSTLLVFPFLFHSISSQFQASSSNFLILFCLSFLMKKRRLLFRNPITKLIRLIFGNDNHSQEGITQAALHHCTIPRSLA